MTIKLSYSGKRKWKYKCYKEFVINYRHGKIINYGCHTRLQLWTEITVGLLRATFKMNCTNGIGPNRCVFYQGLYFRTNKTKLMTCILCYIPALFIFSFIYNIYEYQQQNIPYCNTCN
jgi:hypothetical protein